MTWDRHPKCYDGPEPVLRAPRRGAVRDPRASWRRSSRANSTTRRSLPRQSSGHREEARPKGKIDVVPNSRLRHQLHVQLRQQALARQARPPGALHGDGPRRLPGGPGPDRRTQPWNSFFGPALMPYYMSPAGQAEVGRRRAKYFKKNIAEVEETPHRGGYRNGLDVNIISNVDRYGAILAAAVGTRRVDHPGSRVQRPERLPGVRRVHPVDLLREAHRPEGRHAWPSVRDDPRPGRHLHGLLLVRSLPPQLAGATPPTEMAELDAMFVKQRTLLDLEERTNTSRTSSGRWRSRCSGCRPSTRLA